MIQKSIIDELIEANTFFEVFKNKKYIISDFAKNENSNTLKNQLKNFYLSNTDDFYTEITLEIRNYNKPYPKIINDDILDNKKFNFYDFDKQKTEDEHKNEKNNISHFWKINYVREEFDEITKKNKRLNKKLFYETPLHENENKFASLIFSNLEIFCRVKNSSIFIYGKYIKLSNNMSQTPMLIKKKLLYKYSVSDFTLSFKNHFLAEDVKFVSAGREDADVQCYGRPFIIEIIEPKNDINQIEKIFNNNKSIKLNEQQKMIDITYQTNDAVENYSNISFFDKQNKKLFTDNLNDLKNDDFYYNEQNTNKKQFTENLNETKLQDKDNIKEKDSFYCDKKENSQENTKKSNNECLDHDTFLKQDNNKIYKNIPCERKTDENLKTQNFTFENSNYNFKVSMHKLVNLEELMVVNQKAKEIIFKGENKSKKIYLATVVSKNKLNIKLEKYFLNQKTPLRVLHRRPNLERKKEIEILKFIDYGGYYEIEIRADAGTYIKEFVNGDFGRTAPSLSSLNNCYVDLTKLSVTKIESEDVPKNLIICKIN